MRPLIGVFYSGSIREIVVHSRKNGDGAVGFYPHWFNEEPKKLANYLNAELKKTTWKIPNDIARVGDYGVYHDFKEFEMTAFVDAPDIDPEADNWQHIGHAVMLNEWGWKYDVVLRCRWDLFFSDQDLKLIKERVDHCWKTGEVTGINKPIIPPFSDDSRCLHDHVIIHRPQDFNFSLINTNKKPEKLWWECICQNRNIPHKNLEFAAWENL